MNTVQTDSGRMAAGFPRETRDCTVRALATCLNIPYANAHQRLATVGRKPRRKIVFENVADQLGLERVPEFSCQRLRSTLEKLPPGRFIVRIRGHVFAVVDGTIHDNQTNRPNALVKMVYRSANSTLL